MRINTNDESFSYSAILSLLGILACSSLFIFLERQAHDPNEDDRLPSVFFFSSTPP